jgi:hypothetical protein
MKHINLSTNYRKFKFHKDNPLASSFFEEMEGIIDEVNEMLKDNRLSETYLSSYKPNDELALKNIKLINMNFNFFLALLNNFKLDPGLDTHMRIVKINLIQLYIFIVGEFKKMRKHDPEFFYFSFDEENRYIYNLKQFFTADAELYRPGQLAFLYLRHVKYYIYKIKKNFDKNDIEIKNTWKCGYYVRRNILTH